jgi:hypothetical protein
MPTQSHYFSGVGLFDLSESSETDGGQLGLAGFFWATPGTTPTSKHPVPSSANTANRFMAFVLFYA